MASKKKANKTLKHGWRSEGKAKKEKSIKKSHREQMAWAVVHPEAQYPLVMDGSSQYEIFHDKKVAQVCCEANCDCKVIKIKISIP